jgi:hypothetical protein
MRAVQKLLILLELINAYCYGRSNGVRSTACMSMAPEHDDYAPQSSIAPVQVLPHSIAMKRGQQLKITVRSVAANYTFRGVLVQARAEPSSSASIVGSFAAPSDSALKTMACGGAHSTITHADPTPKSHLLLLWKAPADFRGAIRFR